ncbi:MAG: transglutaminase domain-containing protein, partial [Chloroflexi bacterium]|nr:transglutaminase domain-containing protein [Chloroflexota bacterium]
FPFEVPEETALYVEPETNIESDDPEIINTADGITAGATDAWDSATAIAEWVHDNIEPSAIGAGAKETLSNKSGDFTSQAYLTIAMCRATGIPSRLVGGLAYSGGKFAQHYWVECYMGDAGWVPLDPSVEEYGWADAPHLRLFQSGAIASLNSVSIVNYTETPEDANTPKSLDLAVGQSRRFAFVQSGTETIRNEYEVTNVREENGIRIYSIKSDLHVKPTGQCKATEVVDFLEIDAEVNPISYHTEKFTIGSG